MAAFTNFLDGYFSKNSLNESYRLIQGIKDIHPDSQHVPLIDTNFDLTGFLKQQEVEVELDENIGIYVADRYGPQPSEEIKVAECTVSGVLKFTYKGIRFFAYHTIMRPYDHRGGAGSMFWHLVFDAPANSHPPDSAGRQLIKDVYHWLNTINENAIWVYDNGSWMQDVDLSSAIKSSNWDTLVLDESFVKGLKRDTHTFFSSEKIYKKLNITWKRGILLLGPPGNGKTESIKALLNDTEQTALYVKSFNSSVGLEFGILTIFEHARRQAPCILIIEDLDSMVTPLVRSFFLNELDGLAQNHGILTIATSNHPERIDDAILNRPSRFDVKYNFSLPREELRKQFAAKWVRKLRDLESDPDIGRLFNRRDDLAIADDVAKKTDGWSFAFLKELFLSFLLRFAHDKSLNQENLLNTADIERLLFDQIDHLQLQILKSKDTEKGIEEAWS